MVICRPIIVFSQSNPSCHCRHLIALARDLVTAMVRVICLLARSVLVIAMVVVIPTAFDLAIVIGRAIAKHGHDHMPTQHDLVMT